MQSYSFKDYIFTKFSTEVSEYTKQHLRNEGILYDNIILDDILAYDMPKLQIGCIIAVEITNGLFSKYLFVDCILDFENSLQTITFCSIHRHQNEILDENFILFSDTLIPNIEPCQYNMYGELILQRYYPSVLRDPITMDPMYLAREIGVTIVEHSLENTTANAQIFLTDYDNGDNIIPAGTIFVAPGQKLHRKNFSITHECIHWIIHRKAALFQILCSGHKNGIRIICGNNNVADINMPWDRMRIEFQANGIAGAVLAPYSRINNLIKRCERELKKSKYNLILNEVLVKYISKHLNVSNYSVSIRLKQCGYPFADGVPHYIDEDYTRAYMYKPIDYPLDITYTVSFFDAVLSISHNERFRELCEAGYLVFVENHFIINSEKFVEYSPYGLMLTEYALNHMDECAIPFYTEVNVNLSNNNGKALLAFLHRDPGKNVKSRNLPYLTTKIYKKVKNTEFWEIEKEKAQMGPDFHENMNLLMKDRKITQDEMAEYFATDSKTLRGWFDNVTKQPVSFVVKLCLILNLPYVISEKLLKSAKMTLNEEDGIDTAFKYVLITKYQEPFQNNISLLKSWGIII